MTSLNIVCLWSNIWPNQGYLSTDIMISAFLHFVMVIYITYNLFSIYNQYFITWSLSCIMIMIHFNWVTFVICRSDPVQNRGRTSMGKQTARGSLPLCASQHSGLFPHQTLYSQDSRRPHVSFLCTNFETFEERNARKRQCPK